MLRRATIVACALSLVFSSALVASATTYTFVRLPPTGSNTGSLGLAVNTVGGVPEVAGRSTTAHPTWYNRGNAGTFTSTGAGTNITREISGAHLCHGRGHRRSTAMSRGQLLFVEHRPLRRRSTSLSRRRTGRPRSCQT